MRRPLEVLAKFDQQLATDKIEGDSLSKFVDFLNQHLSVIAPPRPITLSLPDSGGDVRLFLYHSQEDSKYALTLAQALQQRKLEPLLPAFEGPEADIKSFNSKQLAECDGVIVCWASASEVWVRAQASGLRNWACTWSITAVLLSSCGSCSATGRTKESEQAAIPPQRN